MNELTEKILRDLLLDASYWDISREHPNLTRINFAYHSALMELWQDQIMLPHHWRWNQLHHLFSKMTDHFGRVDLDGWDGWYLITEDDCYCAEDSNRRLNQYLQSDFFDRLHPEFVEEKITEEDVFSLGIRPKLVPDKKGQLSMF